MSTTTQVLRAPRPAVAPQSVTVLMPSPNRGGSPRRTAVGLMAGGLTVVVAALGLVTTTIGGSEPAPVPAPAAAAVAPSAPATEITISGPDGVAVHRMGYDPHGSSAWHRHSGLHAVAVLSGTLTIYGPDCQARRYAAGESYVGGQGVHLARNETDEHVEMSVTYLFPAGVPLQDFVIPSAPPAGCDVR